MNVLETATTQDKVDGWRVVISGEAGAAISQLTDVEQEAVRHGLTILQRYGIHDAPSQSIAKLDSPEPLYALRLPDAPDVRLMCAWSCAWSCASRRIPLSTWRMLYGRRRCATFSTPMPHRPTDEVLPGFRAITFDLDQCRRDLDALDTLLASNRELGERRDILPLMNCCATISPSVRAPPRRRILTTCASGTSRPSSPATTTWTTGKPSSSCTSGTVCGHCARTAEGRSTACCCGPVWSTNSASS